MHGKETLDGDRLRQLQLRALRDRQIIESVTEFAIIATDREAVITDWNRGAEQILGWSMIEMVGQTPDAFFTPEDRANGQVDREIRATLATGRGIDERWHLRKDGTRFWASGEMMLLRDDVGEHIGFVKIMRDRTEQHLAGLELAEAKARLEHERLQMATMFDQAPSFMCMLRGPEHRFEFVNPAYQRLTGHRDILGRPLAEALPDAAAQGFADILDHVYESGETYTTTNAPFDVQAAPGGPIDKRYLDFVYQPIRDSSGAVTGIFVDGTDATDRVRSAAALSVTQNLYDTLVNNIDVGICIIEMIFDAEGRPIDYLFLDANPALEREAGMANAAGKRMREFAPNHEQHWFDTYGAVAMTGEPAHFQNRAEGLGGRWFDVHAIRVGEPAQRRVAVLFTDITKQKAIDDKRTLLNREMAHRLKNTLAVVQSVANQTLRTAPDMPTARDALTKRILTLSKAHDILLTGEADAGSLEAIIRSASNLHDPDGRITLRGADLLIGPKAALTLSLIMHELSTNAAKYGALSVPNGRVHIAWVVEVDETARFPTLALSWRELDGPPVTPPKRKGFGTRLIEMGLSGSAGGSVELDYAADGLKCRIVASLTELQAGDEA